MSQAEEARSSSEQVLARLGVEVPRGILPLLDDVEQGRPMEEVVRRSLALNAVLAAAYGYPANEARDWIARHELDGAVTPREARFLEAPADAQAVELQYDVEALWALVWCLKIVPELDLTEPCADFVDELPYLDGPDDAVDRFERRAGRRDDGQILRALDLAYLLNWLHRAATLEGTPRPQGVVDVDIVESRRRALEWVLYGEDWDDITLDT